MLLNTM